MQPGDHDFVLQGHARLDHAHIADQIAGRHAPLLDHVLVVDHQQITPKLIGAEGNVRHQESIDVLFDRHPHPHEIARQQRHISVFEDAPDRERASRGVDIRRDVIDQSVARIACLNLQADLDRDGADRIGRDLAFRPFGLDAQDVGFAQGEIHPDRVDLDRGREFGGRGAPHILPDRNLMGGDHAIERRVHPRVGVFDRRLLRRRFGLLHVSPGRVPLRQSLVDRGLGREVLLPQLRLTDVFRLGLFDLRIRGGLRRLCLLQLAQIGKRLDGEQHIALLDHLAVLIADVLQEAGHSGDQIDLVDGGRVAGRFDIARDLLLCRRRDQYLGRRRCRKLVGRFAARQNQHGAGEQHARCRTRGNPATRYGTTSQHPTLPTAKFTARQSESRGLLTTALTFDRSTVPPRSSSAVGLTVAWLPHTVIVGLDPATRASTAGGGLPGQARQ